jgi:DNA-binding beta-propeller fold protein YncE
MAIPQCRKCLRSYVRMVIPHCRKRFLAYVVEVVGLMLFAEASWAGVAPPDRPTALHLVRVIETNTMGVPNPVGLAFAPDSNTFMVLPAHNPAQPADGAADLTMITLLEEPVGVVHLAHAPADPLNMVFDSTADRLLLFDSASSELIEIKTRPVSLLDPAILTRFAAQNLGVQAPRGMTRDPTSGRLFILDGAAPRFIRIDPATNQHGQIGFSAGRVSHVDLAPLGLDDLHGLAFNSFNRHLYMISREQQQLYELTESGEFVAAHNLAPLRLRDPQAMVFAPSGDLTDDPALMSLYIADSGLSATEPGRGSIVELSLTSPAQLDALVVAEPGVLVRTVNTYQWSPPSPDPMGIVYLPTVNRLLLSDSEVEESPATYFHGVNLFEVTLSGSLAGTSSTLAFSNEPTGLAFNPNSGHLFISEDDGKLIFEIGSGSDGQFFTSDDSRTSFSTQPFNSRDPEGVAFNSWNGHLFIADGLNAEVYDIAPGANGRFDGAPPAGDDTVSHFDTANRGLRDPEGIIFNSDTGTLYLVSSQKKVFELTTAGGLVSMIDLAFLNPGVLSGVAYGPGSGNPAAKSLYIIDRGVDNNDDENENDGKLYEIALGQPVATAIPTNTPTPTRMPSPTSTPTPIATLHPTPIPQPIHINLPLIISQ